MYQTALYNEHYFEVPMVSAVERFHCNSPYKKERFTKNAQAFKIRPLNFDFLASFMKY